MLFLLLEVDELSSLSLILITAFIELLPDEVLSIVQDFGFSASLAEALIVDLNFY